MVSLCRWDRPIGVPAFSAAAVSAEFNAASGEEDDFDIVDDVDDESRLLLPAPALAPLRGGRREIGPKSAISQYPFVLRCLYTPLYT